MPDIPTSLDRIGTVESTAVNVVYVYPVSSLQCQGRVTGVEYCYQEARNPSATGSETVFTVLLMSRVSTDTGEHPIRFTVNRVIPILTPTSTPARQCSESICCDSYKFTNAEQFELPHNDFNLGVLTPSSGNRIIAFHSTRYEYRTPGYEVNGVNFNVDVDPTITQYNVSLRIMKLLVTGKLYTVQFFIHLLRCPLMLFD